MTIADTIKKEKDQAWPFVDYNCRHREKSSNLLKIKFVKAHWHCTFLESCQILPLYAEIGPNGRYRDTRQLACSNEHTNALEFVLFRSI